MTTGRIVLIGNEKGGTGKTTVAITLAAIHASQGRRAALIDADPGQHSATAWLRSRAALHPGLTRPTLHPLGAGNDLPSTARTLAVDHDLVLIDTGASDGAYLRAGLTCAHTMVLPTSTDALELWVLTRMEALMKRARDMNRDMRLVVAATRTPSYRATATEQELAAWIAEHTPDMPTPRLNVLVQRAAVSRAAGAGLGVTELDDRPDPKANREARALYDTVMTP